ncbi:hypothetical protein BTVI_64117 [Pitangus sulphuratus]|nr:hypothetical protein BTVI_64117 [Pitangus sulphuratus]
MARMRCWDLCVGSILLLKICDQTYAGAQNSSGKDAGISVRDPCCWCWKFVTLKKRESLTLEQKTTWVRMLGSMHGIHARFMLERSIKDCSPMWRDLHKEQEWTLKPLSPVTLWKKIHGRQVSPCKTLQDLGNPQPLVLAQEGGRPSPGGQHREEERIPAATRVLQSYWRESWKSENGDGNCFSSLN